MQRIWGDTRTRLEELVWNHTARSEARIHPITKVIRLICRRYIQTSRKDTFYEHGGGGSVTNLKHVDEVLFTLSNTISYYDMRLNCKLGAGSAANRWFIQNRKIKTRFDQFSSSLLVELDNRTKSTDLFWPLLRLSIPISPKKSPEYNTFRILPLSLKWNNDHKW